ncbi:hypothetical protein [Pseudalkalibacillus caeni]|uniref:Uncharacterized protein n=1 Tax=Exobacillus caeni TaxID=2574798 RepID=A0A5R9F6T8_9BACL|nr:hypothetical protein [Pseudalkalibacillus caeni]TLS38056.1 hypothetical protein FCL54_05795 [Pseudalkalibacillus caeni]
MAGVIFGIICIGLLLVISMVSRLLLVKKYSFHTASIIRKKNSAYLFGMMGFVCLLIGIGMALFF